MSIKNITLAALTATALSTTLPAIADKGAYFGAQYAITEYEQSGTNGVTANDGDAKPTAFVITAGYSFSKHIALEGRWGFGMSDDEIFAATATTSAIDVDINHIVSVLGKFSLGGPISPYVVVGFSDAELDATGNQTASVDGVSAGLGIDFSITEKAAISLEYIDYADADVVGGGTSELTATSLGFNYKF